MVGARVGALNSPRATSASLSLTKFGEPSPVTGSQPGTAEKPCAQHTNPPAAQLLLPVILIDSLIACDDRDDMSEMNEVHDAVDGIDARDEIDRG